MENNTEQVFLLNPSPHDQHTTPLQRAFAMPVAAMEPEDIQQTTVLCQLPQDSMHPPSRTNMCRLCATITELVVPIFEGDGLQNSLADKIHQHLPIQVSPNDILPIVMCFQCTSTLMAWHELVVCSAQADTALRERFTVGFSTTQEQQHQQSNIEASETQSKDIEGGAAGQAGRSCAQCGRRFADAGNLARHARAVHAARRPHACATCGARFSRRDHLQEHARAHAAARDFLCEVCGAATKSRAALRMHRVSHGAARHACPECSARFKRRAELRAHLSVHSGERAHACPACPRTFRLRAQLNAHARTHARTRALICSTRATAAPPATSNLCPSEPIPQTRLK